MVRENGDPGASGGIEPTDWGRLALRIPRQEGFGRVSSAELHEVSCLRGVERLELDDVSLSKCVGYFYTEQTAVPKKP